MTAARRPLLIGALAAAVTALVASAAVAVGAETQEQFPAASDFSPAPHPLHRVFQGPS
jgi:hypothetical protein